MPHTDPDTEGDPWTFQLDNTGDIDFSQERQTVRTIHGGLATVQDLKVALDSFRQNRTAGVEGDDPRDPDFGLDVFRARRSAQSLQREVRRTLEYDDYRHSRVSSVQSVQVRQHAGREMEVEATISLADEPETLTLTVSLVTGDVGFTGGSLS